MITIDSSNIKKYERDLQRFAKRALPFANKAALNGGAFNARKLAQKDIQANMITRNRWTIQSIRVVPAKTLNVRKQEARVGSIAPYMETQEFGGTKSKRGKHGVAIPTSFSAGQGENSKPRLKLPTRSNKLLNIRLSKKNTKGKNRKQRNIIAIKQAAKNKKNFVYLDLGKTKGIFRVKRGSRRKKLYVRNVKMVHSLEHRSVDIPKRPWLKPAVDKTRARMPQLYLKALMFQVKRHGLFKPR